MTHTPIIHCPQCHVKDFIKNGKSGGKQRYKCKSCQYNFTVPQLGKGIDRYYVRLSLRLYLEGLGFRSIERIVGVSHVSVMNRAKKYGKELRALRLCEQESIEAVEVDELHGYVGSKKNYVWLWRALDGVGRRVLGFTIGDRSEQTGERLGRQQRRMSVTTYYTDYWGVCKYFSLLRSRYKVKQRPTILKA